MKKITSLMMLFLLLGSQSSLKAQQQRPDFITFINQQHDWVDSVYRKLNKRQRIAQVFMVRAHTNLGQAYIDSLAQVIEKEDLGGVVMLQGGPVRHAPGITPHRPAAGVP